MVLAKWPFAVLLVFCLRTSSRSGVKSLVLMATSLLPAQISLPCPIAPQMNIPTTSEHYFIYSKWTSVYSLEMNIRKSTWNEGRYIYLKWMSMYLFEMNIRKSTWNEGREIYSKWASVYLLEMNIGEFTRNEYLSIVKYGWNERSNIAKSNRNELLNIGTLLE